MENKLFCQWTGKLGSGTMLHRRSPGHKLNVSWSKVDDGAGVQKLDFDHEEGEREELCG
jgi:hypothetical protein